MISNECTPNPTPTSLLTTYNPKKRAMFYNIVVIFYNMPITWQVFHDFGMMIVVLVQRNKFNWHIKLLKYTNTKLMFLHRSGTLLGFWKKLRIYYPISLKYSPFSLSRYVIQSKVQRNFGMWIFFSSEKTSYQQPLKTLYKELSKVGVNSR